MLEFCISSVSACSSGHPSHVLKQLGYSHAQGIGSARISASSLNSYEECQHAADILAQIFAGDIVARQEPSEVNVFSLPANSESNSTVVDINRRHRGQADKYARRVRNNH